MVVLFPNVNSRTPVIPSSCRHLHFIDTSLGPISPATYPLFFFLYVLRSLGFKSPLESLLYCNISCIMVVLDCINICKPYIVNHFKNMVDQMFLAASDMK